MSSIQRSIGFIRSPTGTVSTRAFGSPSLTCRAPYAAATRSTSSALRAMRLADHCGSWQTVVISQKIASPRSPCLRSVPPQPSVSSSGWAQMASTFTAVALPLPSYRGKLPHGAACRWLPDRQAGPAIEEDRKSTRLEVRRAHLPQHDGARQGAAGGRQPQVDDARREVLGDVSAPHRIVRRLRAPRQERRAAEVPLERLDDRPQVVLRVGGRHVHRDERRQRIDYQPPRADGANLLNEIGGHLARVHARRSPPAPPRRREKR